MKDSSNSKSLQNTDSMKKSSLEEAQLILYFFGNAIKNLRKSKRWSLTTLAKQIKSRVLTSYLSKIENGKQNTSLVMINKIFKALDVDIYSVIRRKVYLSKMQDFYDEDDYVIMKKTIIDKLNLLPYQELLFFNAIFKHMIEYWQAHENTVDNKTDQDNDKESDASLKVAGKIKKLDGSDDKSNE